MTILKKLVATTGKYTDGAGNEKRRYATVGHVHQGQHGKYITLDPGVSLAGIYAQQQAAGIAKPGDNRLYLNLYDPDNGRQGQGGQQAAPPAQPPGQEPPDDDIPF